MNTKRCQICWTGTACGEFMGIPMCLECLSHRLEIDKDMYKLEKHISKHGAHNGFHFFEDVIGCIPKLKSESEWQWWQGVCRTRAYEILDTTVDEIQRLRESEHDARVKFNRMFERAMNTQRALLRLRIGFAKLARTAVNDKGIIKNINFWDKVRYTFIFRLDRLTSFCKRRFNDR